MDYSKLLNKNNLILIFFSLLPISFIIGSAVLQLNIFLIIISFLREILFDKKKLKELINNRIFLILILFWIYLIINSLAGINYEVSLKRSLFFFRYILLLFAFKYFLEKELIRNKIINIWTIILLFVAFDICFEFIFGKNILGFESVMKNERIVSFFKDELIVGSYLATFLFIIFGKFFDQNKFIFAFILFAIFSFCIFLTGERSIALKIFISLFLIIFFVIKNSRVKIYTILFSSFLIALIFSNQNINIRYLNLFNHIEKNFENKSIYDGLLETKYLNQSLFTYEISKENYLMGVGTKNYLMACSNLIKTSEKKIIREKVIYCYTHPHQFYYEFISEHGLIGTLIIFIIIFTLFSKDKNINIDAEKKRKLFIFKIYIILSLIPIIPSGSFFSSLHLFQFFLNYSFYQIYLYKK